DHHIPGWREDSYSLRYALNIPADDVWSAHQEQKQQLLRHVVQETNTDMNPETLTIGFARRMTAYKRPGLIFRDVDRLKRLGAQAGGLQLIFAGKAHPRDEGGKEFIRKVVRSREEVDGTIKIAF